MRLPLSTLRYRTTTCPGRLGRNKRSEWATSSLNYNRTRNVEINFVDVSQQYLNGEWKLFENKGKLISTVRDVRRDTFLLMMAAMVGESRVEGRGWSRCKRVEVGNGSRSNDRFLTVPPFPRLETHCRDRGRLRSRRVAIDVPVKSAHGMLMSVNGRLTRPPRATETKAKKKRAKKGKTMLASRTATKE